MQARDAILGRRSIRSFTSEQVSEKELDQVLEAGRWAPSGLNNQPWRFMVLDETKRKTIAEYTKYSRVLESAAAAVAVFLDEGSVYDREKDLQAVGACVQNMLLTIHDLGLGGVWLGEILNRRREVQDALGVRCELMAVVAFGHPSCEGSSHRKNMDELRLDI